MPRMRIVGLNEEQVVHALGIDDAYEVERTLAEGRTGVTQRVTIEGSGPFVRKKIPTALANRTMWAVLADCESPRLPQVATTYEMPDCFVAVYDYIPGDTLEHIVAARGRLTVDEAVQIVQDICEALSDLHAHGAIHCDVNPSNVIVAADGAHLIDFDIAQVAGQRSSRDTVALGTWGFAALEQYGFAPVDARSDVYSLAQLLGYMLIGIFPDLGNESFVRALDDSQIVPPALVAVVKCGSAFEPSSRYQSAEGLSRALASACGKPNGPRMPDNMSEWTSASASWNASGADSSFAQSHARSDVGNHGVSDGGPWLGADADHARKTSEPSNKARIALAFYREVRDSRFLQCAILLVVGLAMSIVGNFLGSASGDPDSPFYMMSLMGLLLMMGSGLLFIIDKASK